MQSLSNFSREEGVSVTRNGARVCVCVFVCVCVCVCVGVAEKNDITNITTTNMYMTDNSRLPHVADVRAGIAICTVPVPRGHGTSSYPTVRVVYCRACRAVLNSTTCVCVCVCHHWRPLFPSFFKMFLCGHRAERRGRTGTF